MKKIISIIAAAAICLSAAACSAVSNGEYPVSIAGYTIKEKPKRVVCLSDSIADILITCGFADSIKARSDECTQQELAGIPTVGSKTAPSIQKIEDIEPDLILIDNSVVNLPVSTLTEENYTVLNMITAQTGDDLKVLYESLGSMMDGTETGRKKGEKKAANLLITLSDLQRIVPQRDVTVTGCYLYDVKGNAASSGSFCGRLFEYANMINICSDFMSNEDVLNAVRRDNPKFIFCPVGVKSAILSEKNFQAVDAVKNGDVYEIDENVFSRQGETMTEVLSFIIETVYPEVASGSSEQSEASQQSKPESKTESKPEESKTESKPEESKTESKPEESKTESKPEESKTESKPESKPEESKPESSQVKADDSLVINDYTAYGQGEMGDDVVKIQTRLKELGFGKFENGITDFYGEQTAVAVRAFEKQNGLTEDGYAEHDDLVLLFSDKVKPMPKSAEQSAAENQ